MLIDFMLVWSWGNPISALVPDDEAHCYRFSTAVIAISLLAPTIRVRSDGKTARVKVAQTLQLSG